MFEHEQSKPPERTRRSWMARALVWARLSYFGAVSLAVLAAPHPMVAAGDGCSYLVNGRDLTAATAPDQAIEVSANEEIVLAVSGSGPLGQVRVDVLFWPLSLPAYRSPVTAADTWSGTVRLADQGWSAQGIYHVVVDEDLPQCAPADGWVRLAGGLPLLTLFGVIGGASVVGGILLLIYALRHAAARGGGLRLSGGGGAAVGFGALIVSQQAGLTHIDAGSTVLWSGLPAIAAVGLIRFVGRSAEPSGGQLGVGGGGPEVAIQEVSLDRRWRRWPKWRERVIGGTPASGRPTSRALPPDLQAPSEGAIAPGEPIEATEVSDEGGPASEPTTASADPPRTTYPRLDAADAIVAGTTFEVVVGLRPEADEALGTATFVRPEWSVGPYPLTIQLLAVGFERVPSVDDPWRVELKVTAENSYPFETIVLRALPTDRAIRIRQLRALYAIQGQSLGWASRPIAVVDQEARLAELEPLTPQAPETLAAPRGEDAPDLTIRIEHEEGESGGLFTWQMLIRDDLGVAVSSNELLVDLGSDAPQFAQDLIASVADHEGDPGLSRAMLGIGAKISRQIPEQFWPIFAQVAARTAPRPPIIQILSAEVYVPWELAKLPSDLVLINPQALRLLGAQADVGRWVIGRTPPHFPPPARLMVRSMAVISGVFAGPAQLEEAEAEAEALETTFDADPIQAVKEAVLQCFDRTPPYEVIHFAVHGRYGAEQPAAAGVQGARVDPRILLADGTSVDENTVLGTDLLGKPLIFLNACQVGTGRQVLGDYSGLAAAFLSAGAAAVVAPLWSVDDAAAREIAQRFYQRVFAGASPAAAIRLERASFMASASTASATFLAYQYYGHPLLKLERVQVDANGEEGGPHG